MDIGSLRAFLVKPQFTARSIPSNAVYLVHCSGFERDEKIPANRGSKSILRVHTTCHRSLNRSISGTELDFRIRAEPGSCRSQQAAPDELSRSRVLHPRFHALSGAVHRIVSWPRRSRQSTHLRLDRELPTPDAAAPPPNRWRPSHYRPRPRAGPGSVLENKAGSIVESAEVSWEP